MSIFKTNQKEWFKQANASFKRCDLVKSFFYDQNTKKFFLDLEIPVKVDKYDLGIYSLHINNIPEGKFLFSENKNSRSISSLGKEEGRKRMHPHVWQHYICLGSLSKPIENCFHKGDLEGFAVCIEQMLNHPNESVFYSIRPFVKGFSECEDCGDFDKLENGKCNECKMLSV